MQLWPKGKEDEHVQSLSKFSRPTRQPLNFCLSCLVDWPRELNQVCSDLFSGHPRMQRFHGNARLVVQVASAQLAWPLAAFFFPLGPSFIGSAAPISTSRAECCKESRAVAVDEKKNPINQIKRRNWPLQTSGNNCRHNKKVQHFRSLFL